MPLFRKKEGDKKIGIPTPVPVEDNVDTAGKITNDVGDSEEEKAAAIKRAKERAKRGS